MVQYKNVRLGAAETERKVSKSRAVWESAVVEWWMSLSQNLSRFAEELWRLHNSAPTP